MTEEVKSVWWSVRLPIIASIFAILFSCVTAYSTFIGADANTKLRVDLTTDSVVLIEDDIRKIEKDVTKIKQQMIAVHEATAESKDDYKSLEERVMALEKSDAVASEVLLRLNDTLGRLDDTMQGMLQMGIRMDERIKTLENK